MTFYAYWPRMPLLFILSYLAGAYAVPLPIIIAGAFLFVAADEAVMRRGEVS